MSIQPTRFVDGSAMLMAGFDQRYAFQDIGEIPQLWHRFGPYIGSLPTQVGKVAYGICHGMDATSIGYMAAIEVSGLAGLPVELMTKELPAERYAVFVHEEHVSKLSETMDAIWHGWFPSSGYQLVHAPFVLERYGEEFDPSVGKGGVEVWFPVKA